MHIKKLWLGVAFSAGTTVISCGTSEDESVSETHSTITPGAPFPNLPAEQRVLFGRGARAFRQVMTPADGLGPVFISDSCESCHALGGLGGADDLLDANHFVERFGTINPDGTYNNLASLGGDVLQTRSIAGMGTGCEVAAESVPGVATVHALRNPLPMFGIGLLAAIPDAAILAHAIDKGDGVHGRPNFAPSGRPGRFGWKAQGDTLAGFNANAANGTMGFTTLQSPNEPAPQGLTMPAGCDNISLGAPTPNDPTGLFIQDITVWALLLAPPATLPHDQTALDGKALFTAIGCEKCHVSSMRTDDFSFTLVDGTEMPLEAISRRYVPSFSDLLLHDMGPEMDEGVTMRQARGSEFRTAPLWGLRLRTRFLHDGRASTYDEAILAHGGEGSIIRDRYFSLQEEDKAKIRAFLSRL